jgi:putative membrane protein
MDFNWFPHMGGFWILPLLCLLFMVIMMFACGGMWSRFAHRGRTGHGQQTARQILERRYAKGEIGKEQFDEMQRQLSA